MKNHTTAKVIAKSVSSTTGQEIVTFELEYPRFIHAEFMTHRMLSKNASSSRAIPTARILEHVRNVPGVPIYWGRNQSGMAANEELSDADKAKAMEIWQRAIDANILFAEDLAALCVHKQIANRSIDSFSTIKVITTATEWANFYWLRDHPAAQPEIKELAVKMKAAVEAVNAQVLQPGQWHLPYIDIEIRGSETIYKDTLGNELSLEDAKIISISSCAQVSYRTTDDTLEKAKSIYEKLMGGDIKHASPCEHQATPMKVSESGDVIDEPGITHMTRDGSFWSANFRGWVQLRKTIEGEAKW